MKRELSSLYASGVVSREGLPPTGEIRRVEFIETDRGFSDSTLQFPQPDVYLRLVKRESDFYGC